MIGSLLVYQAYQHNSQVIQDTQQRKGHKIMTRRHIDNKTMPNKEKVFTNADITRACNRTAFSSIVQTKLCRQYHKTGNIYVSRYSSCPWHTLMRIETQKPVKRSPIHHLNAYNAHYRRFPSHK